MEASECIIFLCICLVCPLRCLAALNCKILLSRLLVMSWTNRLSEATASYWIRGLVVTRFHSLDKLRTRAILYILHSHCLIIAPQEISSCSAFVLWGRALWVAKVLAVLFGWSRSHRLLKAGLSMLVWALAQIRRILLDGFAKIARLVTSRCCLRRTSQIGLAQRQTAFKWRVSCCGLR